jgi:hypothetical protein
MVCIRLVSQHSSIILLNLVDPGIFTWNVLDLQLIHNYWSDLFVIGLRSKSSTIFSLHPS